MLTKGLSLPMEMPAFKAALQKSQQSMMESLLKGQTVLESVEPDCENITANEEEWQDCRVRARVSATDPFCANSGFVVPDMIYVPWSNEVPCKVFHLKSLDGSSTAL